MPGADVQDGAAKEPGASEKRKEGLEEERSNFVENAGTGRAMPRETTQKGNNKTMTMTKTGNAKKTFEIFAVTLH